jgi:hypothetical protein
MHSVITKKYAFISQNTIFPLTYFLKILFISYKNQMIAL